MKMYKKIVAILMVFTMAFGLLTGCNKEEGGTSKTSQDSENGSTKQEDETSDDEVTMETIEVWTNNASTKEEDEKMKEIIVEELKRTFRPEFLNRIDEVIVFHSLMEEQIKEIVEIMVEDLEKRMKKLNINIKVSDETIDYISNKGFDPVYGARPLERTITKMIEDQLAEEILKGSVSKDDSILIDFKNDKLVFEKEPIA